MEKRKVRNCDISIGTEVLLVQVKRKKVEKLVASYYEPGTLAELDEFKLLVNKILALMDNPYIDLDAESD